MLNLALPKGRLLSLSLARLNEIGFDTSAIKDERKLLHKLSPELSIFIVRNSDIITYLVNNMADLAFIGSDMLLEEQDQGQHYYDYADLAFGGCRLMVAGKPNMPSPSPTRNLRVATKYRNIAVNYYAKQGIQTEIVKVNGSVELAATTGFVDYIVDIVATGKTLAENNLVPLQNIADISTRVIINKGIMKSKWRSINSLLEKLTKNN